jgi:hypothetical protein
MNEAPVGLKIFWLNNDSLRSRLRLFSLMVYRRAFDVQPDSLLPPLVVQVAKILFNPLSVLNPQLEKCLNSS